MSDPREKVRNLLIKARHAGTPAPEAELSRTVAANLARKYGLDLERIERDLEAPQPMTTTYRPNSNVYCRCGRQMAVIGGLCLNCAMDAAFGGDTFTMPPQDGPPPRDPAWDRVRWSDEAGPRPKGGTTSTGRQRVRHDTCTHEPTPAARAKCRREQDRKNR